MDISVGTRVTAVTAYPDRALVTVSGQCEIEAGAHRLLVGDLPLQMETGSLRVSGQGTARVRLLGADVVSRFFTDTPAEHVQQLEQSIQELADEQRLLEDAKNGWLAHAKYVDGLRAATEEYARGLSRGHTSVAEQVKLVAFIQEQDQSQRDAVRDLDKKLRDIGKRLDKLQNELKQASSARPRRRYEAQVEVQVDSAGTFDLAVSYLVGHAGWNPLYDVRLLAGENGRLLDITLLAEVHQNTGQSWQDVALTVSTAQPALNQRLPQLHPWYIDQEPPMLRSSAMQVRSPMPAAAAPMDAVLKEPEAEKFAAEAVVADVEGGGETAVRFKVSQPVTISDNGQPHKTTLALMQLLPNLDYVTIPRHTDAVFRRVTVVNNTASPLLSGPANLFVDDEFIGKTKLAYTPTGDQLELLLGVEERITVKRELVKRDVDKRLLSDNRQLKYGYEMKVKNLLPQAVEVVVEDQLPVSRHEQIRVKVEQMNPEPVEKTTLNLLKWRLKLASAQEGLIHFSYQIEHPRDMRVIGLQD